MPPARPSARRELGERLLDLAERAELEVVSWDDAHANGWAAHQNDYAAIEREASRILIWQPSIMVHQLHRIASLAQLPSVDLAVLPSDTDMNETYEPSAVIYLAPHEDANDLAVVELATSVVRESKPKNVDRYIELFRTYQANSVRHSEAIEFVQRIAGHMEVAD